MAEKDWLHSGFNNNYWNPIDFLLPGTSLLNHTFDPKGTEAAQQQFDSQLALQQQAQSYNAEQAQIQRDFEERMANTELSRRYDEAEKLGVNPYWAIMQGAASTPSGASAQTSAGSAAMANNKMAAAAGVIAVFLRALVAKH